MFLSGVHLPNSVKGGDGYGLLIGDRVSKYRFLHAEVKLYKDHIREWNSTEEMSCQLGRQEMLNTEWWGV